MILGRHNAGNDVIFDLEGWHSIADDFLYVRESRLDPPSHLQHGLAMFEGSREIDLLNFP